MNALNPSQFSKKKDFLNCHSRKLVVDELRNLGESAFNGDCMSDFIFLYDKKLKKKRVVILITSKNVICLDLTSWKPIFMSELSNLSNVSISSKNCTLVSFSFVNGDLLMESYRRIDLIVYCARYMKEASLKMFKLKIRKNFKSSNKPGKGGPGEGSHPEDDAPLKDIPLKDLEKAKKQIETGFLQETIRNSKKSGYLRVFKKGLFSSAFSENFFILSDLGLVCFKKYGDKKAQGFLPILGGSISVVPKNVYNKDNIFNIRFADEESVLQASSKVEMEDWIKLIKDLQEKCLTSKDTIKEIGRIL